MTFSSRRRYGDCDDDEPDEDGVNDATTRTRRRGGLKAVDDNPADDDDSADDDDGDYDSRRSGRVALSQKQQQRQRRRSWLAEQEVPRFPGGGHQGQGQTQGPGPGQGQGERRHEASPQQEHSIGEAAGRFYSMLASRQANQPDYACQRQQHARARAECQAQSQAQLQMRLAVQRREMVMRHNRQRMQEEMEMRQMEMQMCMARQSPLMAVGMGMGMGMAGMGPMSMPPLSPGMSPVSPPRMSPVHRGGTATGSVYSAASAMSRQMVMESASALAARDAALQSSTIFGGGGSCERGANNCRNRTRNRRNSCDYGENEENIDENFERQENNCQNGRNRRNSCGYGENGGNFDGTAGDRNFGRKEERFGAKANLEGDFDVRAKTDERQQQSSPMICSKKVSFETENPSTRTEDPPKSPKLSKAKFTESARRPRLLSNDTQDEEEEAEEEEQDEEEEEEEDIPSPPKKQLSAYNFFFQHERARLLLLSDRGLKLEDHPPVGLRAAEVRDLLRNNPYRVDGDAKARKSAKGHGKVSFMGLVKHVSKSWRAVDRMTRAAFESVAREDKVRYKREMREYRSEMKRMGLEIPKRNQHLLTAAEEEKKEHKVTIEAWAAAAACGFDTAPPPPSSASKAKAKAMTKTKKRKAQPPPPQPTQPTMMTTDTPAQREVTDADSKRLRKNDNDEDEGEGEDSLRRAEFFEIAASQESEIESPPRRAAPPVHAAQVQGEMKTASAEQLKPASTNDDYDDDEGTVRTLRSVLGLAPIAAAPSAFALGCSPSASADAACGQDDASPSSHSEPVDRALSSSPVMGTFGAAFACLAGAVGLSGNDAERRKEERRRSAEERRRQNAMPPLSGVTLKDLLRDSYGTLAVDVATNQFTPPPPSSVTAPSLLPPRAAPVEEEAKVASAEQPRPAGMNDEQLKPAGTNDDDEDGDENEDTVQTLRSALRLASVSDRQAPTAPVAAAAVAAAGHSPSSSAAAKNKHDDVRDLLSWKLEQHWKINEAGSSPATTATSRECSDQKFAEQQDSSADLEARSHEDVQGLLSKKLEQYWKIQNDQGHQRQSGGNPSAVANAGAPGAKRSSVTDQDNLDMELDDKFFDNLDVFDL